MAYIVVSDVHLGSKSGQYDKFCEFLEWLNEIKNERIIKCKHLGKGEEVKITIKKPEKIILLGDILELWDTKDGDRDNVIKESIKPFALLSDIGSEKVYVVGNHDEALSELREEVDEIALPNDTKFVIRNKHYPDDHNGLKIGNISYFFVHGQQFDKEQAILAWMSRLTGESWDPLGWFQSLFNITSTKKHWKKNLAVFFALFLVGALYWKKLLPSPIPDLTWTMFGSGSTLIIAIVAAAIVLYFALMRFHYLSAALFVIFSSILLFSGQSSFTAVLWGALTGFFALCSIPGVVANTQRKFYNLFKSKDKTAEQIIKNGYYRKDKDTIKASVVVFGHTHFASYYGPNNETGNKLFINSGCWYGKDIPEDKRYTNTFVYIDEGGAYVLRWRGVDEIDCIEAFPAQ